MRRRWTREDDAKLRLLAREKTSSEIAEILGRSPVSVRQYAQRMGISMRSARKLSRIRGAKSREPGDIIVKWPSPHELKRYVGRIIFKAIFPTFRGRRHELDDEVNELTQESLVYFYDKYDPFRERARTPEREPGTRRHWTAAASWAARHVLTERLRRIKKEKALVQYRETIPRGEEWPGGPVMPSTKPSQETSVESTEMAERLKILTPREREVVALYLEGFTREEAAKRMGIRPDTVGSHRDSAMRKLRVNPSNEGRFREWYVLHVWWPEHCDEPA